MSIRWQCPKCGSHYTVDEKHAGKKGRCKACGHIAPIPRPGDQGLDAAIHDDNPYGTPDRPSKQFAKPAISQSRLSSLLDKPAAPTATDGGLDLNLLAQIGKSGSVIESPDAPIRHPVGSNNCPDCGRTLAAGVAVCVNCGYNLKTSQRMGTNVGKSAAVRTAAKPRDKVRSKPSKQRDDEEPTSGAVGWAYTFMILSVGAPILPLFGYQFRLLSVFGEASPFMGIPVGIVAALILFCHGLTGRGVAAIILPLVGMGVALSLASRMPDPAPDEANSAAEVAPAPAPPAMPTLSPTPALREALELRRSGAPDISNRLRTPRPETLTPASTIAPQPAPPPIRPSPPVDRPSGIQPRRR